MDVVEMVLTGRVNKSLVTLIQQAGGRAVGLCGKDSAMLDARQMVEKVPLSTAAHPTRLVVAHHAPWKTERARAHDGLQRRGWGPTSSPNQRWIAWIQDLPALPDHASAYHPLVTPCMRCAGHRFRGRGDGRSPGPAADARG